MKYPSYMEVMKANHELTATWYRFLPVPGEDPSKLIQEQYVMEAIMIKLKSLGGIPPKLSKQIGWDRNAANKRYGWIRAIPVGQSGNQSV